MPNQLVGRASGWPERDWALADVRANPGQCPSVRPLREVAAEGRLSRADQADNGNVEEPLEI